MKRLIIALVALAGTWAMAQETAGTVDISVTTVSNGTGFSPKHVLAIWIEDGSGSFVKTLKLNAKDRKKYLYTWNSNSGGNTVDAVTGSTLSSHTTHNVSWNCTNTSGTVVADGEYKAMVEYTSEHAQGPLTNITFTKDADGISVQPADASYFKDMDLVFTPESSNGIAQKSFAFELSVYPVPVQDVLNVQLTTGESGEAVVQVYSIDMKLVDEIWRGSVEPGTHEFSWNVRSNHVAPGTYMVVYRTDHRFSARRVVIR